MKTFVTVLFLICPCIIQVQAQKIGFLIDDYIIEGGILTQNILLKK